MKTGFVNAFVNKPLNKNYSYHGILKDCNVQPNPAPFIDIPNDYSPIRWELWVDEDYYCDPYRYWRYTISEWTPSSDNDPCPEKFPNGKCYYYFVEISYWNKVPGTLMSLNWNNGLNCKRSFVNPYATFIYKAWFDRLWEGRDYICRSYKAKLPSHIRIWRSSTGDFPGYYPVPQDFYYY